MSIPGTAEPRPEGAPVTEVVLDGDLDLCTFDQAQHRLEAAEETHPAHLVIDLSRLTFIDSTGVRLVLLAHQRAQVAGRRLSVRLGDGPGRRVFIALGLDRKLDIDPPPDAPPERSGLAGAT
jgi:anti-sigma B factor antagonist